MRHHANPSSPSIARIGALIVLSAFLSGCGRSEPLGPRSLRKARETWLRTGIRSYDLDWTVSGPQTAGKVVLYRVVVRGGLPESVKTVRRNGTWADVHTHNAEYFTVDGLFRTLEEELAQLKSPTPFGKPKGTSILLDFVADDTYGFPRRYRRDIVGEKYGLSIDVIQFHKK